MSKFIIASKAECEFINILSTNRTELIKFIDAKIEKSPALRKAKKDGKYTYLFLQAECGCTYSYKNKKEIPSKNVVCEHGNKIIVYTDNK
jgi:predicted adenine nucleotide alpha hydrolase (AANH) superfamily ATPase